MANQGHRSDAATRWVGGYPGDASGWALLIPAERDVVRLVSEGLGKQEIATRLFVSPRTVATHLTPSAPSSGSPHACSSPRGPLATPDARPVTAVADDKPGLPPATNFAVGQGHRKYGWCLLSI